jgi:hypothetical protein
VRQGTYVDPDSFRSGFMPRVVKNSPFQVPEVFQQVPEVFQNEVQ